MTDEKGIQLSFRQSFHHEYLRNNKANGGKNLRCFPCCSEPTHKLQGFCGQPVIIDLVIDTAKISVPLDKKLSSPEQWMIVGEFQPLNEEYSALEPPVNESDIIRNSISANQRYFLGKKVRIPIVVEHGSEDDKETEEEERMHFEVRFEARPWLYTWHGNRFKRNVQHAFIVSILTPYEMKESSGCSYLSVINETSACSNSSSNNNNTNIHSVGYGSYILGQFASPSFFISSIRRNALPTVSKASHAIPVMVKTESTVEKMRTLSDQVLQTLHEGSSSEDDDRNEEAGKREDDNKPKNSKQKKRVNKKTVPGATKAAADMKTQPDATLLPTKHRRRPLPSQEVIITVNKISRTTIDTTLPYYSVQHALESSCATSSKKKKKPVHEQSYPSSDTNEEEEEEEENTEIDSDDNSDDSNSVVVKSFGTKKRKLKSSQQNIPVHSSSNSVQQPIAPHSPVTSRRKRARITNKVPEITNNNVKSRASVPSHIQVPSRHLSEVIINNSNHKVPATRKTHYDNCVEESEEEEEEVLNTGLDSGITTIAFDDDSSDDDNDDDLDGSDTGNAMPQTSNNNKYSNPPKRQKIPEMTKKSAAFNTTPSNIRTASWTTTHTTTAHHLECGTGNNGNVLSYDHDRMNLMEEDDLLLFEDDELGFTLHSPLIHSPITVNANTNTVTSTATMSNNNYTTMNNPYHSMNFMNAALMMMQEYHQNSAKLQWMNLMTSSNIGCEGMQQHNMNMNSLYPEMTNALLSFPVSPQDMLFFPPNNPIPLPPNHPQRVNVNTQASGDRDASIIPQVKME